MAGNWEPGDTHTHSSCFCAYISRHVEGEGAGEGERLPDSASRWSRQNEKQRI